MINIEPNYDEMMKLYERLETAKEEMGDRYLLHPANFVQKRIKANDSARNSYLHNHYSGSDKALEFLANRK